MTVKLKDLNKSINKIKRKVFKMLTTGTVPKLIEVRITADIKNAQSAGKMPNESNTKLKKAPTLTPKTRAYYQANGVSPKPRFEFTGELKNSIQPRRNGNQIKIGSTTASGRNKLKWLKKSNKTNGKPKKTRIALGWTKARTKIIRKIIRSAIARNFK